jgi:hypothetical protein
VSRRAKISFDVLIDRLKINPLIFVKATAAGSVPAFSTLGQRLCCQPQ